MTRRLALLVVMISTELSAAPLTQANAAAELGASSVAKVLRVAMPGVEASPELRMCGSRGDLVVP